MPARIERNYDNVSRMMGAFEVGAASKHGAAGVGVDRGAINNLLEYQDTDGRDAGRCAGGCFTSIRRHVGAGFHPTKGITSTPTSRSGRGRSSSAGTHPGEL